MNLDPKAILQALQQVVQGGKGAFSPIPQNQMLQPQFQDFSQRIDSDTGDVLGAYGLNKKYPDNVMNGNGISGDLVNQAGKLAHNIGGNIYNGVNNTMQDIGMVGLGPLQQAQKIISPLAQNAGNDIQGIGQAIQGLRPGQREQSAQPSSLTPLENQTLDTFQNNKIHPAVAYGIAQAEGGKIGNNNLWNIGATDSNPDNAVNYNDTLSAASGAATLINSMLKRQGALNASPTEQLKAIERAGYAGDPKTWKQRSIATNGAGKNFDHWSDFVKSTASWQKWIEH